MCVELQVLKGHDRKKKGCYAKENTQMLYKWWKITYLMFGFHQKFIVYAQRCDRVHQFLNDGLPMSLIGLSLHTNCMLKL